jgi:hypothetical protein
MLLLSVSDKISVKNIELAYFVPASVPLVDTRKTDKQQLWLAGCSVTHGVGVELQERYGHILGKSLNLSTSFLTRPGSSIPWAADQILRSDIRENDIIVWGITTTSRLTIVANNKLLPGVSARTFELYPEISKFVSPDDLTTQNVFYENVYAIERVLNYCSKIKATIVLLGVLSTEDLLRFLKSKSNFYNVNYNLTFIKDKIINYTFLDLGSDNRHPGRLQHQQYADICQSALKNLNFF